MALTVGQAATTVFAVVWVAMCAAWHIYHFLLARKHGIASKSTRPVSFFLVCEAVSYSGTMIIVWATGGTGNATANTALALITISLLCVSFFGLALSTLFAALGFGVVRNYDAHSRRVITWAMVVAFAGPIVVAIISVLVSLFVSGGNMYAVAIVMALLIFVGTIGCIVFYAIAFVRLARETIRIAESNSEPAEGISLSEAERTEFLRKFRVFRIFGFILMAVLIATVPSTVYFSLSTRAPPLARPAINAVSGLITIVFGAVMAWTYLLRSSTFSTTSANFGTVSATTTHSYDDDELGDF